MDELINTNEEEKKETRNRSPKKISMINYY